VGIFTSSFVCEAGALHHPSFFTVDLNILLVVRNGTSSTAVTIKSAQPLNRKMDVTAGASLPMTPPSKAWTKRQRLLTLLCPRYACL
jgi:hypothetical protein